MSSLASLGMTGKSTRGGKLHRPLTLSFQHGLQEVSGVAGLSRSDRLRRTGGNDLAAARSPFGTQIDDPISGLDDVEIVLDH